MMGIDVVTTFLRTCALFLVAVIVAPPPALLQPRPGLALDP